jgi:hypothetical protein
VTPHACPWESEVLAAVLEHRWPDAVDSALREHAAGCAACGEVAAVAGALGEARGRSAEEASLPDAGLVWWRAKLRARREAARAAGRPITAAQVLALACACGLFGACFGATSEWFQKAFHAFAYALAPAQFAWPAAATLVSEHGWLVLAGAALLLAPAALWLVLARE